jgi:hypothetical protein
MKNLTFFIVYLIAIAGFAQHTDSLNKAIARDFYQNLWFTQNTDAYQKFFNDRYIIRDIGDQREEIIYEDPIQQKEIADFLWSHGDMSGTIDYQVAGEGKVVTRWYWQYKPTSLLGRIMIGDREVPIINTFHFEEGKIVEINNHRHDVSMNRNWLLFYGGLLLGLLVALIPTLLMFRYRKRLKKATN